MNLIFFTHRITMWFPYTVLYGKCISYISVHIVCVCVLCEVFYKLFKIFLFILIRLGVVFETFCVEF
jgi:hypothetical protein